MYVLHQLGVPKHFSHYTFNCSLTNEQSTLFTVNQPKLIDWLVTVIFVICIYMYSGDSFIVVVTF